MAHSSQVPFLSLSLLGPLISLGLLAFSVFTAIMIIAFHYSFAPIKNRSILRILLTSVFLLMVLFYIGGQASALTFTAVSGGCTARNKLLTAGDHFARISSAIVGLNIVARTRGRVWTIALLVWLLARLVLGIVAIVLVNRELGSICLPSPNIIVNALGIVLDFLLDIFVIIRSSMAFMRSEQDSKIPELILLAACLSKFSWHLGAIPLSFRIGSASSRIIPYAIFLSILTCLLAIFHAKVPTPAYVVLPSKRELPKSPTAQVIRPYIPSSPRGTGPEIVRNLFSAFRRDSAASVTGAPARRDREPPLMRYGISKDGAGGPRSYGIVKIPTDGDSDSVESWRVPKRKSSLESARASVAAAFLEQPEPTYMRGRSEAFPRKPVASYGEFFLSKDPASLGDSDKGDTSFSSMPKSGRSSMWTDESSLMSYPVTAIPIKKALVRKAVPRKTSPPTLKIDTNNLDEFSSPGKLMSDETLKNNSELLALSRKVAADKGIPSLALSIDDTSFSSSFTQSFNSGMSPLDFSGGKREMPRSQISIASTNSASSGPPKTPLPPLPTAVDEADMPTPRSLYTPIRKRMPRSVKEKLSTDLAMAKDPSLSLDEQTNLYTGVLKLLNEVMSNKHEIGRKTKQRVENLRQSLSQKTISEEDARLEFKRLSQLIQNQASALEMESTIESNQSSNTVNSPRSGPTEALIPSLDRNTSGMREKPMLERSRSTMMSEAQSTLGQHLNRKLEEVDDLSEINYDSMIFPRDSKAISSSSMEILIGLEKEVSSKKVWIERKSTQSMLSTSSASYTSRSTSRAEVSDVAPSPEPVWEPSAELAIAARLVVQSEGSDPRSSEMFVNISVRSSRETSALWTGKSSQVVPDWIQDIPEPVGGLWSPLSRTFVPSAIRASDKYLVPPIPKYQSKSRNSRLTNDVSTARVQSMPFKTTERREILSNKYWSTVQNGSTGQLWTPPVPLVNKNLLKFISSPHLWSPQPPRDIPRASRSWNPKPVSSGLGQQAIIGIFPPIRVRRAASAKEDSTGIAAKEKRLTLWKPVASQPPPSAHMWQSAQPFNSQRSILISSTELPMRATLWTNPLAPQATSPAGLWKKLSPLAAAPKLFHMEWQPVDSVSQINSEWRKVEEQVNYESNNGLWRKPIISKKSQKGLWNSHSTRELDFQAYLPPVRSTANFLDDIPFIVDGRPISEYATENQMSHKIPKAPFYMRVLEYDFPLPPTYTTSPLPRLSPYTSKPLPDIPSVTSEGSIYSVEVDGFNNVDDPAYVHPVFMNSYLSQERGGSSADEKFPVHQLHPACLGYFNYTKYQSAMENMKNAESGAINKQNIPQISISPPSRGNSIQRRRASKNNLSLHWRNRSANLSVNMNLIEARRGLRSPTSPLTAISEGTMDSGSPMVHLSPAQTLTPLVEAGEVRPLSPNKLYLLRQGILYT